MKEDPNRTNHERARDPRSDARHAAFGDGLARLEELGDYEIADGEPDIRGWTVRAADGSELGKVAGLIADPAAMEIRYIEASIKHEVLGTREDEHVLIPIGVARLNDHDDTVIVERLPVSGLRGAPRFGRVPLTAEHARLLVLYHGATAVHTAEALARFYGKRRRSGENAR